MSVRLSLLALLDEGPRYGYQLRQEFERRTGGAWPLNVGQVYSTLARLERDGLVEPADRSLADSDDRNLFYAITPAGRDAVRDWFAQPVERTAPARDELAIKLALAVTVPGVDVHEVLQRQRTATLRALQGYTRLKAPAEPPAPDGSGRDSSARSARDDLAWALVLESLIFAAEAEVRWLDHCEARLARAALAGPAPTPPPGDASEDPRPTDHASSDAVSEVTR